MGKVTLPPALCVCVCVGGTAAQLLLLWEENLFILQESAAFPPSLPCFLPQVLLWVAGEGEGGDRRSKEWLL